MYNLALTTLADQSVVIGTEKKEDNWYEKLGLTSLYDNLVLSHSVARQLHNSQMTVTRHSHDRPNIQTDDFR